jgi:hypothetical protein
MHVEVLVAEPDVAHRHDSRRGPGRGDPTPVTARAEDALELTIAEEQAALVLTNLETTQHHQCHHLSGKKPPDGAPAATPRAWSAA